MEKHADWREVGHGSKRKRRDAEEGREGGRREEEGRDGREE